MRSVRESGMLWLQIQLLAETVCSQTSADNRHVIYITVNQMEIRQRVVHSKCCCVFLFPGHQLSRRSLDVAEDTCTYTRFKECGRMPHRSLMSPLFVLKVFTPVLRTEEGQKL